MTIANSVRTAGPFLGDGVIVNLPFTFMVFKATDLVVNRTSVAGVISTLVLSTDYTVSINSNQNTSPGGTVVLMSPSISGAIYNLTSAVPLTQLTDLTNQGGFYPEVITAVFDKITILIQQVKNTLNRSLTLTFGDTTDPSTLLAQLRQLLVSLPAEIANRIAGDNNLAASITSEASTRAAGDAFAIQYATNLSTAHGVVNGSPDTYLTIQQPYTGAVPLTQNDKNLYTISVKEFGAVVNGVTDDTTAITNSRANASGKYPVIFCGKTYASGYWENLSPLVLETGYGDFSNYKTDVVSTKPVTATRLFNGTVQTGSGFAGYGHRTDIYTKTGVDVASTVGFACFVNSLSTNSSGPATNNNTNQTAILANASAQSTTASAPVTAINAIASSAYTGTVWQPVVGVEVDISVANPPGFFGEASKSAGIGFSVVLSGNSTYSASTAFGCDTSKGGFGWLNGVVLSGCVNTGLVIARNTVTPTIGVWVSAATTYGIYVGAKNLSPLNPGNVPAFDANHNPAIGIALGQTGATVKHITFCQHERCWGRSQLRYFNRLSGVIKYRVQRHTKTITNKLRSISFN
jgi:hypothetical protein